MGYPELLKLINILDLVIISITHADKLRQGNLIKWLNLNVFTVPC